MKVTQITICPNGRLWAVCENGRIASYTTYGGWQSLPEPTWDTFETPRKEDSDEDLPHLR